MKKKPERNKTSRKFRFVVALLLLILVIFISAIASPLFFYEPKSDIAFLQEAAGQAFQLMRFDVSRDISKSALEISPASFDLNMIHATSQLELGNRTEAKTFFRKAFKNSGALPSDGFCDYMLEIASGLRSRGRLSLSELALEVAYEVAPNRLDVGEKYALLKAQIGSRCEARKIFADMLSKNVYSLDCLVFLANEEIEIDFEKQMKEYWVKAPEDPLTNLGVGYYQFLRGEVDAAIHSVESSIASAPNRVDAHALLGRCLLVQDPSRLAEWESKLPSDADSSPGIWYVRAMMLKGSSDIEQTQLALLKALKLLPSHTPSLLELTRVLILSGKKEVAEMISAMTRIIQSAHKDAKWLNEVREDTERMGQLAQHLDSLARSNEIRAWSVLARRIDPHTQAFAWMQNSNQRKTVSNPLDSNVLGLQADKSYKGNATVTNGSKTSASSTSGLEVPSSAIPDFIDKAMSAGVEFRYFSGRPEPISGRRMHEFGGGGVGILDYDRDGWPDLYLAQGCRLSMSGEALPESEKPYLDKLFRNLTVLNEEPCFIDATEMAGIRELGFGQGVSIGDLNSDGFDDIYVCNVGPNTLWINQGDGTFQEKSDWIPEQNEWTVSAAIADLDADGIADIFDVNYVKGEKVYELLCDNAGKMTACGPNTFTPTPDRFLLSSHEGPFMDRSHELANVDPGNGLGIVAFRSANSRSISLYIANDATPNVLVESCEKTSKDTLGFEDMAILKGVAFDGSGMTEGSMGIAAGDANRDGLLDFFVTNVFHESFTLYVQDENGSFEDRTGAFRLTKPTYDLLGFGTQFVDVNRDGFEDLVGVNGDVDDLSHSGRPFQMSPFLFVNNKGKSFISTVPTGKDSFFNAPRVGRALAIADLNRDGSMDFVGTFLDGNTAVVMSKPADDNFYLVVEVVGTQSERTAIGTRVTVNTEDGKIMRQLTAGGGYMSTNERILHFGLGKAKIQSVQIEWPSGIQEILGAINPNSRLLLIEPSARSSN